jgi:hypothetical protein
MLKSHESSRFHVTSTEWASGKSQRDFLSVNPSSDPRKLICGEHGEADACIVCAHLQSTGPARGFNGAQHPNAAPEWSHLREARCDACDWWLNLPAPIPSLYTRFVASPHLVCARCFEEIAASNWRPGNKRGWWLRSMTRRGQPKFQSSPNSKR